MPEPLFGSVEPAKARLLDEEEVEVMLTQADDVPTEEKEKEED